MYFLLSPMLIWDQVLEVLTHTPPSPDEAPRMMVDGRKLARFVIVFPVPL
jgi:hypothetical protein